MLDWLIRRSGEERLQTLSAFVLYENRAMLDLARRAGFVARGRLGLNVELALALGRRGAPRRIAEIGEGKGASIRACAEDRQERSSLERFNFEPTTKQAELTSRRR